MFRVYRFLRVRTMLSQDVRLSGSILSKRLFHRRVAHYFSLSVLNVPTMTRLTGGGGGSNATVWKSCHFRPISRFISEMIQDRAIITMEGK